MAVSGGGDVFGGGGGDWRGLQEMRWVSLVMHKVRGYEYDYECMCATLSAERHAPHPCGVVV